MAKKSNLPAATNFNYSVVDKDTKSRLIWLAGAIRKANVIHVKSGLEKGQFLAQAHDLFQGHDLSQGQDGAFRQWVEQETGHCLRSAYNYMDAFRDCGAFANFANIQLSAMYVLTSDEGAKRKAIKLADKGVAVTHAVAKKLVDESKPKPTPRAPATPQDAPEPDPPSEPTSPPKPRQTAAQEPEQDYGKCPACAGTKWTDDEFGAVCSKCNQPHGEPAGDTNEDALKTQRQKSRKTGEALMRAFDDLQCMKARQEHSGETKWAADDVVSTLKDMGVVAACKGLLKIAEEWK